MLEEKLSLEGKTIVITGGGTGLGREMTLAMASAGADLVIASRRIGPIDEVAQAARDMGRRAITVSTDVTDTSQVAALMERAPTPAVHRMANMLVEQLLEIMPELAEVSAWHNYGQRRSLDEYGVAVERSLPDHVFESASWE